MARPGDTAGSEWAETSLLEVLDHVTEGFQILSPDWRYLYVNDAVCHHARKGRHELIGRRMTEVYPGISETEMFGTLARCMRDRAPVDFENLFEHPDGEQAWFELRVRPVPEGLLVISTDVTERRSLERQLLAAQRMEAVGRLAGGVAHDFNNILTAIMGFGDFALGDLDGHPARADVEEVLAAAQRAAQLVGQLLAFSRRQPVEPRVVDVADHLRDLERMLARVLGEDIELTVRPDADLWPVRVDPTALEQAMMNLAVNARDAMAEGGTLRIEARNVSLPEAGDHVRLSVTDDGVGMDAETRAQIFEPFFTTKELGRGSGLGLSTCYGIVKRAGGLVRVDSELGKGSTFQIFLPRVHERARADAAPGAPSEVRGAETILVVEDDEQVRTLAQRALSELGYAVLAARESTEGLALATAASRVDLLLTDLVLPGSSGRALAAAFQRVHPWGRVLYMSGYADGATPLPEADGPLLQKPFAPGDLAARVRGALGQRTA